MVKSYYKHHRDIIWHDFYATINFSAIFFDIRTHLNNNGFLIKQRRQQRFLNEHHLLISSAIQWKLFHRLHFSSKLSKSFTSMTNFCGTLNFLASFFEYRTHSNNNGFLIKQRHQQRFLNEHHLVISSATQWKLLHRLHFLLKLSKSFINKTGFCATLNLSASFFEYRTRLNNNGFLIK